MPDFYMIIVRRIFFPYFFGAPSPTHMPKFNIVEGFLSWGGCRALCYDTFDSLSTDDRRALAGPLVSGVIDLTPADQSIGDHDDKDRGGSLYLVAAPRSVPLKFRSVAGFR